MSLIFFDQLGLPEPDLNLGVGSGSHAAQTAALMVALERAFEKIQPDRVVIYGDVNSTLAAAIVASKLEIAVAHVEAGLRSFDRGMPEEVNRVVSDALASLHFVTSEDAIGHLLREGVNSSGIHFVGNPMIDTLLRFRSQLHKSPSEAFGLSEPYGLVTLHRPSNVDNKEVAAELVSGLVQVSEFLPLVVPLHPRGRETLSALGLKATEQLVITEPLGYMEFMSLLARASVVLTDSGGVQEETTVLGVPCLTLRDNTERPITIEMGTNRLVARRGHAIVEATLEAMESPPKGSVPPLWDGDAGGRIARILLSTPVGGTDV
jgi:UDP-N-acetylglucosamine 2-epimerase (non-hydrolysing)